MFLKKDFRRLLINLKKSDSIVRMISLLLQTGIFILLTPYGFCDIANSDPANAEMVFVKENRELTYCGIYRYEVATGKTFLISKEMELPMG